MLSHHDVTMLLFSVGLLLGFARLMGEIARYFHQPAVLGELLAGIILGPTIFGYFFADAQGSLFPMEGAVATGREAMTLLAVVLFLLVAGLEVDLSSAWRSGRVAIMVSIFGMLVPFGLGFGLALGFPSAFGMTENERVTPMIFALFFGTALCISALPVISKILLDLNLFKTDLGMIVVSSAIVNDLLGWIIFAIILSMIGVDTGSGLSIEATVALTLLFAGLMLTVGRWFIHRTLPWMQAHLSWPGGVLGFAMTFALLAAAFTEWIGIHAIFGAFLFGVALGDSRHLRERTRATLDQFISFIFAPIFFASVGLKVNFVENFNLGLVLIVLVVATLGKVVGCGVGARLAGMPNREAWAVGFGMNARGAMEIILGLLALQAGLITDELFVALVVMALATSMVSGTMMQRLLRRPRAVHFVDFISGRSFIQNLKAVDRRDAIRQLVEVTCNGTTLNADQVREAVFEREAIQPTGLANMVAIPHARIDGLTQPIVGLALCEDGVDFDATDGQEARMIFLILTDKNDTGSQLEILSSIARMANDQKSVRELIESENFTELLAALKLQRAGH